MPEDDIKQLEQRLGDNADVIPGDSNDSSVLKKAGIDRCRAILALSDNDADNAFVVLSAKDMSSDVKTVLAVSDSKNLNKIKMVHPDIILSPQLFGSEILARVLNGEEINNDMLVSMLLNSGHGIFSDNDEQETKAGVDQGDRVVKLHYAAAWLAAILRRAPRSGAGRALAAPCRNALCAASAGEREGQAHVTAPW